METNKSTISPLNRHWAQFLTSPRYRILRHLLLIMVLTFIVFNGFSVDYRLNIGANIVTLLNWILVFIFWGLILINIYILIPRLLFQGRYIPYILSLGILILVTDIVMFVTMYGIEQYYDVKDKIIKPGGMLVLIIIANVIATGFYIFAFSISIFLQQWLLHNQQVKKLQQDQVESELKQLKDQIQPDFLSRILNKVNLLVQQDPPKASLLLVKFSHLLRYQLYDAARDNVLLKADISFVTDYLKLEQIYCDKFDFELHTEGDTNQTLVPPLLFAPIIENVIKNITFKEDLRPSIEVQFDTTNSKELSFMVTFPFFDDKIIDYRMSDLHRRLELLYDSNYLLSEYKEGDNCTIKMILPL